MYAAIKISSNGKNMHVLYYATQNKIINLIRNLKQMRYL